MKKRGINTLITTILIIGLVFALASILTMWGVSFTKKQTADVEKEFTSKLGLIGTVDLKLKSVELLPNHNVKLIIENKGKKYVEQMHVRFFNNDERTYDGITTTGITAYSIKDFLVAYDNSFDVLVKVEIFPQVKVDEKNVSLPSLSDSKAIDEPKNCANVNECIEGEACCENSCLNFQCSSDENCNGGTCQFSQNPCLAYCLNYGGGGGGGGGGSENPTSCIDSDADGYDTCDPDVDCNDNQPSVNPGTLEICMDGFDNDCDGQVDEECDGVPPGGGGGGEPPDDGIGRVL